MSKEERKVPELRFKGFHDDWEQRKLKDILIVNSGKDYKHLSPGPIPVFGTGGHMLSVNDKLSNQDGIGLGRKGTINKPQYLNSPFWTVDTLFYLTSRANNSLLFQYYVAQDINWLKFDESTGVPSLSKKTIENITKYIPTHDEQIKNGEFFKKLDRLITLHQRKINTLEALKKTYLNVMFPNNDETTPRLRFNSFKEEWEQRKLGDFILIKSGWSPANFKEIRETNENLYIKVDDLNYSFREQMNSKLQVEDNSRFIKVKKYSTIFPKRGAAIMTNKVRYLKQDAYMDTNMMALEPLKINDLFLYTFIEKEGLFRIADTSTIPQINNGHINPYPINLPNGTEQNIIGIIFESMDKIIELNQKKVNNLNKLKKLYLRKMFL